MRRWMLRSLAIVALTLLTQIGGLAYLVGLRFRRAWLAAPILYVVFSLACTQIAPSFGRVPLPCLPGGVLQMQSVVYCAMNRHYVVPELAETLDDLADAVARRYPGTVTLVLDASFPFVTGFPLLPHLSHDDGEKVDLAFYYRDNGGYRPGVTRSPIGYFAFERGPSDCPDRWPTLRWDFDWLQPLWPPLRPDPARMRVVLDWLNRDPRVGKVLLEPHLKAQLAPNAGKIRFQGCRAARHDDHIHLQL